MNRMLWAIQILLALVFLFAGAMKLIMPMDQIAKQLSLPVGLIHFVGVAEILGAIGLILPWLLQIRPWLTPLAAAGLLIIMIGATVVALQTPPLAGALLPFVTGLLCAFLARGRWRAP